MEELQDAIEDVQYLQAVNSKDSGPSPTESWPFPSEKALEDFNTKRLQHDGRSYSLETICAGILGLYLVGTFCAEREERSKYEFILDVIRYRRLRTPNLRLRSAQMIIQKFFGDIHASQEEADVLVGKAPLRRDDATPACRVELERVRSDIRIDTGAGANRLGVTGPMVTQLARLALPTDSNGAADASVRGQDQGREKGGNCRGEKAGASEADDHAQSAVIGALLESDKRFRDGLEATEVSKTAHANGANFQSTEVRLTKAKSTDSRPARDVIGTTGVQNTDHRRAANGESITASGAHEEYHTDLFDVLEAWVFEYLQTKLHADFLLSSHFQEYVRFLHVQHRPVTENDFILFRVLGRGGFGAVNGCKRGASGKLFAMKVMNKRRIKIRQSEDLCWNERRILEALGSPFVVGSVGSQACVSLKYAFESKNDLFLILDLMTGGDLGFHLQQLGIFTPVMAQYYTARTVLGIRHLHQKGIVYRDLKPENVMLDEHGRSRISDMGLACKVTPHLTGACGTRGYWAPEMRLRDAAGKRVPYNESVDWFSLGCILYEFLRGISPFRTETAITWCANTIQDKEKRVDKATLEMEPEYPPKYFDNVAADLCAKLMMKNPAKRLGNKGAEEILAHPWFATWDRDALAMDQVESPYVPTKDINAAPQRAIGSFADAGSKVSLSREDQALYEGWEYTSVNDFQQEVVDFLTYRNSHSVGSDSHSGGCCSIC